MTPLLYWSLLLLVAGFAVLHGRKYERAAALACLGASLATLFVHQISDVRYVTVAAGDMLVDCAALAIFIIIALRSDRFWPLWVAGLQLVTSFGHFLKAIDPELVPQAYGAALRLWSYPILVIVFIGAWRSWRRDRSPADLPQAGGAETIEADRAAA